MLLEKYYRVILVLFIFIGTPLCRASRNARFSLRELKERAAPGSTSSYNQGVLDLEKRQFQSTTYRTSLDSGPVTDITTIYDTVVLTPGPQPTVVIIVTSTSIPTTTTSQQPTSTSTSTTSRTTSKDRSATKGSCNPGYFLCAAEYDGGCCKSGFTCAIDSCIPPATLTEQRTCSAGLSLCPAWLNYGCCPGGYQCDTSSCLMTNTGYNVMTITNTVGPTVTNLSPGAVDQIAKASDINLFAKQPVRTGASPATPTESPLGPKKSLSGVVIGGIVAGCVIGILVLVLVVWCAYSRAKSRGNTEPPMGVPTTNFFDPAAGVSRTPGSGSSTRYHPVVQESYFQKPTGSVNHQPTQPVSPPPEGVVEMGGNPITHLQGRTGWWGEGGQALPEELPGDNRAEVYEVEGTVPAGNTRRWSKPFTKRQSGGY